MDKSYQITIEFSGNKFPKELTEDIITNFEETAIDYFADLGYEVNGITTSLWKMKKLHAHSDEDGLDIWA